MSNTWCIAAVLTQVNLLGLPAMALPVVFESACNQSSKLPRSALFERSSRDQVRYLRPRKPLRDGFEIVAIRHMPAPMNSWTNHREIL
jgi:hypothetical protein